MKSLVILVLMKDITENFLSISMQRCLITMLFYCFDHKVASINLSLVMINRLFIEVSIIILQCINYVIIVIW